MVGNKTMQLMPVAINEAIDLAKLYSDDIVAKMINAVLDKVYHEMVENER